MYYSYCSNHQRSLALHSKHNIPTIKILIPMKTCSFFFSAGSVVVVYTVQLSAATSFSVITDMSDALYAGALNGTFGTLSVDACSFALPVGKNIKINRSNCDKSQDKYSHPRT